jgi:hypothetical protein
MDERHRMIQRHPVGLQMYHCLPVDILWHDKIGAGGSVSRSLSYYFDKAIALMDRVQSLIKWGLNHDVTRSIPGKSGGQTSRFIPAPSHGEIASAEGFTQGRIVRLSAAEQSGAGRSRDGVPFINEAGGYKQRGSLVRV